MLQYLRCLSLALAFLIPCTSKAQSGTSFRFGNCTVILPDSSTAAALNLPSDAYTKLLTPFDLSIRMNQPVATELDYLNTAASGVHSWTAAEQELIQKTFDTMSLQLTASKLKLPLPDTLYLIRSDTKEEFGAEGYTRANRIMLNTNVLPVSGHLVAHELFHVLSRLHKTWRDSVYAVFHFVRCNNIDYKPLVPRAITNPDCPYLMNYIRVTIDGKPQDVTLLLYAQSDYTPGKTINDYAQLGLLALSGKDKKKKLLLKEGQPVIYSLEQVPDFFRQVGNNSAYILHIEELSAEHFAALVNGDTMKQPEYLEGMKLVLQH